MNNPLIRSKAQSISEDDEPIHLMFGLTYANYLVLNRSLLQSMPVEWQRRFVSLLDEFEFAFADTPRATRYRVNSVGDDGRFTRDPVPHYDRGRTYIKPRRITVLKGKQGVQ